MQKYEIFVSENGSDTNDGSISSPLKTVYAARKLASTKPDGTDITIYLRGGDYYTESGIRFTKNDTGMWNSRSLTLSAYENEKVRFIGGIEIDKSRFSKVTDEKILSRLIYPEAKEKLWRMDLSDHKNDLYTIKPNRIGSYHQTALFMNGKTMEPARYPKRSTDNPALDDEFALTTHYTYEDGENQPVNIFIEDKEAEHIKKWNKSVFENLWISGYPTHAWWDENHRIASVDMSKNMLTTDKARFTYQPSKAEKSQARYFLFNIFDELRDDGEMFIDYENGYVYLCLSDDIDGYDFRLGVSNDPLLSFDNTTNITVKNIDFLYSHTDICAINGCNGITIDGCTIAHGTGKAVMITDSYGITIKNSDIYDFSNGGIQIEDCGEEQIKRVAGITIENCILHDVTAVNKCYNPCVQVGYNSSGVKITGCTMYNSPHNLIHLGLSQDVTIEYCEFYNASVNSDDASVIYWGRNPATLGHRIHDNYFHQCRNSKATYGQAVIYQDDNGTGADIYNNVFYDCAAPDNGGRVIQGAEWHHAHNNIFICKAAPDAGNVFGWNYWAVHCSGAYSFKEWASWSPANCHVNHWFTELQSKGFFTEQWRRKYKGTFWEKMYDVLNDDAIADIAKYRHSLDNEPLDVQNKKLLYFAMDYFWSHTLIDGTRYEGSVYDCIKELFPEDYAKACKEVEGKGELAYLDRMSLLVLEMYWFDKFKADYSVWYDGNLTIGVDPSNKKDGKVFLNRINQDNNFDMDDDKMPDGKSIFVDFGKDFTLTKEGEEFVKSHIEGFTPIDMSKIGAKR